MAILNIAYQVLIIQAQFKHIYYNVSFHKQLLFLTYGFGKYAVRAYFIFYILFFFFLLPITAHRVIFVIFATNRYIIIIIY